MSTASEVKVGASDESDGKNQNLETATKWIFAGLVVLTIGVAVFANEAIGTWGSLVCAWVGRRCHDVPYIIGFAVLLLLWLFYRISAGDWNILETTRGADNRWSTSKCQFFLWTVVALFSYASLYAARIGAGVLTTNDFNIPTNLLLAMGLSVTTAVAAKGITVSQLSDQTATKEHIDAKDAQTGDLIKDDGGAIDLTKVQMLGWTIVALGAYIASVAYAVQHIQPTTKLPDIDTALMVLMGLGQGAYLAKKLITTSTPTISKIDPAKVRPGREVTINGTSFGVAQGQALIAIDGVVPAPPLAVKSWSDTSIAFLMPNPPLPAGFPTGQKPVSITLDGGTKSNSYPITILPRGPQISAITLAVGSTSLTISGSGFGAAQSGSDFLKINDKPSGAITNWSDTAITFGNPDPGSIRANSKVSVKIYLDGDTDSPAAEQQITLK
jgi:hypothetical protein